MNAARLRPALALTTLALSMLGCAHKGELAPAAPVATAPPLQPDSMTVQQSLPPVPPVTAARVSPPPAEPTAEPTSTSTKPPARHRRHKPDPAVTAGTTAAPATPGAAPAAAEASPGAAATTAGPGTPPADTHAAPAGADPVAGLVELSAGSPVNGADRNAMLDQIKLQENRLRTLKTGSSGDSAAVVIQVRSFLEKARLALTENDLDGARTLTTKAKLLIDELSGT
jgi:hypothetical protein